jgi:hypothetical protein
LWKLPKQEDIENIQEAGTVRFTRKSSTEGGEEKKSFPEREKKKKKGRRKCALLLLRLQPMVSRLLKADSDRKMAGKTIGLTNGE